MCCAIIAPVLFTRERNRPQQISLYIHISFRSCFWQLSECSYLPRSAGALGGEAALRLSELWCCDPGLRQHSRHQLDRPSRALPQLPHADQPAICERRTAVRIPLRFRLLLRRAVDDAAQYLDPAQVLPLLLSVVRTDLHRLRASSSSRRPNPSRLCRRSNLQHLYSCWRTPARAHATTARAKLAARSHLAR